MLKRGLLIAAVVLGGTAVVPAAMASAAVTLHGSIMVESNPVLPGSTYEVMVGFSTVEAIGRPVQIVRSDGLQVGPTTIPDGVFEFPDTAPTTEGSLTYTLSIPADADVDAFTSSITVQVQGAQPTTLTLNHNGAFYNYGTTVSFTAQLGRGAFAPVAIYADPAGTDPRRLLASRNVDGNRSVTTSLKLTRNTLVTAVFAGDSYSKPATASVMVYTRASVSTAVSKHYKTKGAYYVFHKKANPVFGTTMTAYPKRKQYLVVESYSGGKWRAVKTGYYALTGAGKSTVTFTNSRKTGVHYRVRAAYLNVKSGDTVNATTYGAYRYFTFTK
ncbi:hypothetical protein [Actinoplanes sp. NPDC026619]|uniref:hypothetical protein n=1 Tax=Actinoplanes sp. NPDC026619 TaxID=3155798 RepID=UPI00341178C2